MEILRTASDWARAEIFSSAFFIVIGVGFILVSAGFWQLGKTDIAKAYVIPFLVAGLLLSIIGIGLTYANNTRLDQFPRAYDQSPEAFVDTEIERVDATIKEYRNIVFTAIPIIIVLCAVVIGFVDVPRWRAISITTIAMMTVILLVDGTAHSRILAYKEQLLFAKSQPSPSSEAINKP